MAGASRPTELAGPGIVPKRRRCKADSRRRPRLFADFAHFLRERAKAAIDILFHDVNAGIGVGLPSPGSGPELPHVHGVKVLHAVRHIADLDRLALIAAAQSDPIALRAILVAVVLDGAVIEGGNRPAHVPVLAILDLIAWKNDRAAIRSRVSNRRARRSAVDRLTIAGTHRSTTAESGGQSAELRHIGRVRVFRASRHIGNLTLSASRTNGNRVRPIRLGAITESHRVVM